MKNTKTNENRKTYFVGFEDEDREFYKIVATKNELAANIIDLYGDTEDDLRGLQVYEADSTPKRIKIKLEIKLVK